MFDLLVGLANDQRIMGDRSQEQQALMNKRQDLQTMNGDIVFTEFKSMIFGYAFMATLEASLARASSKRTRESKIFSAENSFGLTHL